MKKKNNKSGGGVEKSKSQPKKQIEQAVRTLTESAIISLGYDLWDIEYYNDGAEWLLEITIDKPETGISLDDCEKVTHAVTPLIDAADPIENSYSLAVSSPGLNRELKSVSHLNKYIDKEVTVKLFAKNEEAGDKTFNAILKQFDESDGGYKFELPENKTLTLTKKEIAHIYAYDEINYK